MTNWWSVTVELEREIQRKFADYTADIWKEDALTIDVVKASRKVLNGAKIQGETEKTKVVARVFKADGAVEERFGDLAVLVRVAYRDGQKVTGVAFYEAKRRDWKTNKLPAAKKGQLAQMHRALWHGHLLVFDRERVATRLTELVYHPWWLEDWRFRGPPVAPVTQALSIPLGPVLQAGSFDTSLYKFGTPFASQLVLRNLQGLDLDDAKQVVAAASGYAKKKDVPATVMVPGVVLAVAVREGPGDPDLPEINQDVLRPVDGD